MFIGLLLEYYGAYLMGWQIAFSEFQVFLKLSTKTSVFFQI